MINAAGLLSSDSISRDQLFSFFKVVQTPPKKSVSKSLVGLLAFFEPSTRTKMSFEKAGLDLGIRWMDLSLKDSSLQKGESLEDTFKTLARYAPDFFVVRHSSSGFPALVHSWTKLPVINAGDGQRDHPTQGLLDAYTLWELDPKRKWKIAFFGDVVRSRVARADIQIFRKLGYSLSVVNDGSLETEIFSKAYKIPKIERLSLRTQEVVICLRIQKERGSERLLPPLCRQDIGSKTYVMHPGPVIVGEDLAHDLCDFSDSRSLIHRQVANGRRVRRALLSELSAEGAKT